uniref:BHLH domain-containing protein n=1 Tax=Meloidogyne hapla TaxID=6305 RepID=A0A1I8BYD8_MELHA
MSGLLFGFILNSVVLKTPNTSTQLTAKTFSSSTTPSNINSNININENIDQHAIPAVANNERPSRKRSKSEKQITTNSATISNTSTSPSRPPKAKRKKSATKEKMRNLEIKTKLRELNYLMPFVGSTELPRIRILRLANAYIEHLNKILNGHQDFAVEVNNEMKKRNSYSHLVEDYEEQTRKVSEISKEISPQSSKSFK